MVLLRWAGGLFFLIALASGVILLAGPLGFATKGSPTTTWVLFLFYLMGGLVLYSMGSKDKPIAKVVKVVGATILALGVAASAVILLAKVQVIGAEISASFWALFFFCIIGGVSAFLLAEKLGGTSTIELQARAAAQQLENQFDEFMWSSWGDHPRVAGSIRRMGGLAAARTLLHQDSSSVFAELKESDRLELSIEATVLQPRWHPLFTDMERKDAAKRLGDSGYRQSNAGG